MFTLLLILTDKKLPLLLMKEKQKTLYFQRMQSTVKYTQQPQKKISIRNSAETLTKQFTAKQHP